MSDQILSTARTQFRPVKWPHRASVDLLTGIIQSRKSPSLYHLSGAGMPDLRRERYSRYEQQRRHVLYYKALTAVLEVIPEDLVGILFGATVLMRDADRTGHKSPVWDL